MVVACRVVCIARALATPIMVFEKRTSRVQQAQSDRYRTSGSDRKGRIRGGSRENVFLLQRLRLFYENMCILRHCAKCINPSVVKVQNNCLGSLFEMMFLKLILGIVSTPKCHLQILRFSLFL